MRVNKSKSLLTALDSHNDGLMASTAHLVIKRKLYETIQSRYLNTRQRLQLFLPVKQEVRDLVIFQGILARGY